MEKNYSSTLAKVYWLTSTTISKPNFFFDYITNPTKRFETGFAAHVGESFWRQYASAYKNIISLNGLILRVKLITNDSVTIKQIYRSKEDRINFINQIDTSHFFQNIGVDLIENECYIDELEKNQIILDISKLKENIIVQYLREDHYIPGIVIGDPLKNERLFQTT